MAKRVKFTYHENTRWRRPFSKNANNYLQGQQMKDGFQPTCRRQRRLQCLVLAFHSKLLQGLRYKYFRFHGRHLEFQKNETMESQTYIIIKIYAYTVKFQFWVVNFKWNCDFFVVSDRKVHFRRPCRTNGR